MLSRKYVHFQYCEACGAQGQEQDAPGLGRRKPQFTKYNLNKKILMTYPYL